MVQNRIMLEWVRQSFRFEFNGAEIRKSKHFAWKRAMSRGTFDRPELDQSQAEFPAHSINPPLGTGFFGGLEKRELRRRLWHISPGIFSIALWWIPHRDPLSSTFRFIMFGIIVALGGRIWLQSRRIRRGGEANVRAAVLGYSVSVLAMFLIFPAHAELGLAVLAILAFGDGCATLGGLMIRSRPLPWNPQKSLAGSICFVGCALPMAALFYWRETHNLEAIGPGVSLQTACLLVAPAVIMSMLAESIPSRINDNFRVGITAAVVLTITQAVMIGL